MKFNKTSSNNLQNINEETKSKLQNSSTLEKLSLEGIACGVKLDPVPTYNLAPCEKSSNRWEKQSTNCNRS
jgi:hypothetical protein